MIRYLAGALSGMLAATLLLAAIVPVPFVWGPAPSGALLHPAQPAVSGIGDEAAAAALRPAPTPPTVGLPPGWRGVGGGAGLSLVPTAGSHPARPSALTGFATWYAWHSGEAAAGPALRAMLGPRWRGRLVRVCTAGIGRSCIVVRLTDFCACGDRNNLPTLVDLDRLDFARLADPSLGTLLVSVTPATLPSPPDTSTAP